MSPSHPDIVSAICLVRTRTGSSGTADMDPLKLMADLFLSYHGRDRESVRAIQRLVQARGISTFLDPDDLARGQPWPQTLKDGLRTCRGVAVFLGNELGAWQKRELWRGRTNVLNGLALAEAEKWLSDREPGDVEELTR
jgi:hypothetical protein